MHATSLTTPLAAPQLSARRLIGVIGLAAVLIVLALVAGRALADRTAAAMEFDRRKCYLDGS